MAYDEGLAQRIREALADTGSRSENSDPTPGTAGLGQEAPPKAEVLGAVVEKKMFGGLAFMLHGNMCVGVSGDDLMVRVGPDAYAEALAQPHAREMDFTGKPLRGFVYVDPLGFESDEDLAAWIERGARFVRSLPAK